MKKMLFPAIAAVMLATLGACGGSHNNYAESSISDEGLDSTLCQFDNIVKSSLMLYVSEENDTFYIDNSVRVFWPTLINGKTPTALQEALLGELVDSAGITTIDQTIACLLECNYPEGKERETLTEVTEFAGEEPQISTANVKVQLQELGTRLLRYHIYFDQFNAGAAHGIYASRFVTYDLRNDKVLTLNDIVADTTLLRTAILKSIKQEYNYGKDDLFIPDNGLLPLPSDFFIDGSVLHAVYQVYDIASYAQGAIDAPIYPYLLKPEEIKRLYTPLGLELIDYIE